MQLVFTRISYGVFSIHNNVYFNIILYIHMRDGVKKKKTLFFYAFCCQTAYTSHITCLSRYL